MPSNVIGIFHEDMHMIEELSVLLQLEGMAVKFAVTKEGFRELLVQAQPDLILMGGHEDAMDVLAVMKGVRSVVPAVVLSQDREQRARARLLGAHLFPEDSSDPLGRFRVVGGMVPNRSSEFFITLIRHLIQRPRLLRFDLPRGRSYSLAEVLAAMSPREHDILLLTIDGLSEVRIAQRLGIAQRTVEVDLQGIMRRLSVQGERQLIELMAEATTSLDGDEPLNSIS